MAIPLIPILTALAAGGSLVPHYGGGMIVTSVASGYVAGTYLSTAAISSLVYTAGASLLAAAGVTAVSVAGVRTALTGAGSAVIGSSGLFGTSIGASGITGSLMSAGVISSTPIAVPVGIGLGVASAGVIGFSVLRMRNLKRKLATEQGDGELHFSDKEAKLVERIIKWVGRKGLK
ncbi:hypothetical protein ACNFIA_03040 [Pseudomonas sp. NY15437]|uniref:hypothetical protein n=1 Tax=Pseudomonas sp. NY15437 TaxID=3400360 RepID=UPI003A8B595B